MRRRRREFTVFTMTFLDVMASGFGGIIMIYLLVNHSVDDSLTRVSASLTAEVSMLEEDIEDGRLNLVQLRNALGNINDRLVSARERARQLKAEAPAEPQRTPAKPDAVSEQTRIEQQQVDLAKLETQVQQLRDKGNGAFGGSSARAFVGEGNRQYLTGLRMGGDNIVILMDVSTSMLDDDLVNILRRRNMSVAQQKAAQKWKRAKNTIEWLVSQLPIESKFQIYIFNTIAKSAIPGSDGKWLSVIGGRDLDTAIATIEATVPNGGTSLYNAFAALRSLKPAPDNIFLITDGLPTQGEHVSNQAVVTGRERERLFTDSLAALPKGVPVNTILFSMDGDSNASAAFWLLAQRTSGTMLSPSRDWP